MPAPLSLSDYIGEQDIMCELGGTWDLSRYSHVVGEVPPDDDGSGVQSWLCGLDADSVEFGGEKTGLQLSIGDGSFSERVEEFCSLMFDIEGIQVNDYQPMSGNVLIVNEIAFLIPECVPEYALPSPGKCAFRYDDGDTKVCDTIRVVKDNLVRQQSVVTDELYLDRITLVYCRTPDVR